MTTKAIYTIAYDRTANMWAIYLGQHLVDSSVYKSDAIRMMGERLSRLKRLHGKASILFIRGRNGKMQSQRTYGAGIENWPR